MDMEAKGEIDKEKYAANIFSIREAQKRINSFIHKTPVVTSESLYAMSGKKLFLKCECFHKGGAFKFRGTCNAISSLDGGEAAKRVVTQQAVDLAKRFCDGSAPRTINGCLTGMASASLVFSI